MPTRDELDVATLHAKQDAEVRLLRIARIIETVDNRAMAADGPVTPTRHEMTDDEMRQIYALATKPRGTSP
jgi:hypothetical protein